MMPCEWFPVVLLLSVAGWAICPKESNALEGAGHHYLIAYHNAAQRPPSMVGNARVDDNC